MNFRVNPNITIKHHSYSSPLARATDPMPNHAPPATLSTRPGDYKYKTDTYPHSLITHIKHPLTEDTTFRTIKPLWTSQVILGTPSHVSTNLQIA